MNTRSTVTLMLLCAAFLFPMVACGSKPPLNRGKTSVVRVDDRDPNERGLGSKDLATATDRMVAEIAATPEIRDYKYRTIVVMGRVSNRTSNPNRDFTIYLARIRANLNKSGAKKNIGFVESRSDMIAEQEREFGKPAGSAFEDPDAPAPTGGFTSKARYVLKGVFYDSKIGKGTTNLMTFQLTSLHSGDIIWEGSYEVKFR
jgi:PBP1b-binding outer membrane lipoprotein LpoB